MDLIGEYKNGNCIVRIYENGTKVRYTDDDEFYPEFAESLDVRITSKCGQGCPWCYEGNKPNGRDAELLGGEYMNFVNSLHPNTEISIGGNDLSHPQLKGFLNLMRAKGVIANITVSQRQCADNLGELVSLQNLGLIRGIGISLEQPGEELFNALKRLKNAVLHVVCGIVSEDELNALKNKGVKVLFLGYKKKGRGLSYYKENEELILKRIGELKKNLKDNFEDFKTEYAAVAFDNLALKQLCVKDVVGKDAWDSFYMGDDGRFSFYVDLAKGVYAKSSTSATTKKMEGKTVDEMFKSLQKTKKQK